MGISVKENRSYNILFMASYSKGTIDNISSFSILNLYEYLNQDVWDGTHTITQKKPRNKKKHKINSQINTLNRFLNLFTTNFHSLLRSYLAKRLQIFNIFSYHFRFLLILIHNLHYRTPFQHKQTPKNP